MKKQLSLVMAAVTCAGFVMGGCAKKSTATSASGAPETLVVSSWGLNDDLMKKNIYAPFEKKYNAKLVFETGNNSVRLTKLEQGETGVDVMYLAEYFAIQGIQKGLFEKIDEKNVPNIQKLFPAAQAPLGKGYGPAYTFSRVGIVYDSDKITTPITSWAQLWDSAYKKKEAIPDITIEAGPLMMSEVADQAGVKINGNQDTLFNKMKALKPNVLKFYTSSSDMVNMLAQGEVNIAVMQDYAFGSAQKAKPSLKWANTKEATYTGFDTINVVKGSKHKKLAEEYINFILDTQVQKAEAVDRVDSPTNKEVTLTAEQGANMTYGEKLINSLKMPEWATINKQYSDWITRWNNDIVNK